MGRIDKYYNMMVDIYGDLLNRKGGKYSKSSLINIRAGLNRHITSPPWNRQMDSSPPSIDPSLPSTDSSQLAFPLLDNLPLNGTTHRYGKKETHFFCHTHDMGRDAFSYKTHSTKQLVMKNKFKWNIRSKLWKWNVYNDSSQNGVSTCATC